MMNDNEVEYTKNLLAKGFIKAPNKYKCGNTIFEIQYDSWTKISHCIFRCKNNKY